MTKTSLKKIFESHGVILAYQFGSSINGKTSKISDVDVAVLFEKEEPPLRKLLQLSSKLSDYFKTDRLDLARLNNSSPLFKHRVAVSGNVLFEKYAGLSNQFAYTALQEYEDNKYFEDQYFKSFKERLNYA